MKVNLEAVCPGCKLGNRLTVKKPGFLDPVTTTVVCQFCESQVFFKFDRYKPSEKKNTSLKVISRMIRPSALLSMMLKQEADENAETLLK